MKIIQSRSFEKTVKKLSGQEKKSLDGQIRKIISNTGIGRQKRGDLRDVYVHKFKMGGAEFLLSYRFSASVLELIMVGPHENYYKDLKKYLKSRSGTSDSE